MKRILIFPAGTEIAFEILNALKFSKFVEIFGGTSVQDHSEYVFKNLITGFPFVKEEGFLDFLNEIVRKYKIDCIYPAHDSVSMFLSEHAQEITAQVIVTDESTMRICRSKKETYKFFAGEKFIPKTYTSVRDVKEYPVFVKPAVGQGSVGAKRIESSSQLEAAIKEDKTIVICEYLEGKEYTVDCFTDRYGTLRVSKLRDRQRVRAGISVRSKELKMVPEVLEIANVLNKRLHFKGAWFFQVKKDKNGKYKLLEVSARIPGTMGVSRNLGINFPMLTLFDFWGYDVKIIDNNYDIEVDRAFYNAYKINMEYDHIYVDYDDTVIINEKVNHVLIGFLYQAASKGKRIHLLSKHKGDLYEDLRKYRISPELFDEICVIDAVDKKEKYVSLMPAIFIDDSFAERYNIIEKKGIPVFDTDMIESLLDWRY